MAVKPARVRGVAWGLCLSLLVGGIGLQARLGETTLIDAVRHGDRRAVAELLSKTDVNAAEADGTTALHWASEADDREMVGLLLGAGADPRAANRYGITPLQLAAVNGDATLAATLIKAGADVNAVLPEGETILMTAARTGNREMVELLLSHGASIDAREHWYGENALMWAAAEDHPDAVQTLLKHGANVNSRSATRELANRRRGQNILPLGGWTPLMYAARQSAMAAGRVLVEAGADLNAVDPDGATALVIAIINANYDFASFLIGKGADPNVVDEKAAMGPLYAAIDMHRLAIGHGRPNPIPKDDTTCVDVVRLLLEHGADPNATLKGALLQRQHTAGDASLGAGATPLMRAAKSGDVEMMRLLLKAGADPFATMPNGATALMFASGLGWRDGSPAAPSFDQGSDEDAVAAIDLLLGLGLKLDAQMKTGDTPLHVAVTGRGSEVIVKALMKRGADLNATNARGATPLEAAKASRKDRSALVSLLESAAGQPPAATTPSAAAREPASQGTAQSGVSR